MKLRTGPTRRPQPLRNKKSTKPHWSSLSPALVLGSPFPAIHLFSLKKPWSVLLSFMVTVKKFEVTSVTTTFSRLVREGLQDSSSGSPKILATGILAMREGLPP